jgi:hypothetical protein
MGTIHSRLWQDIVTSDALPPPTPLYFATWRDAPRAAILSCNVVALPLRQFHRYCDKWMCTIECDYTHSSERRHAH